MTHILAGKKNNEKPRKIKLRKTEEGRKGEKHRERRGSYKEKGERERERVRKKESLLIRNQYVSLDLCTNSRKKVVNMNFNSGQCLATTEKTALKAKKR